ATRRSIPRATRAAPRRRCRARRLPADAGAPRGDRSAGRPPGDLAPGVVAHRRDLRGERAAVHPRGHARRAPAPAAAARLAGRGHPLADAGAADRPQEPQGDARQLLRDRRLHGGEPGVRDRGRLPRARRRRAPGGDARDPRLGAEPHGVRPPVDHRAPRLLRARPRRRAGQRPRQRGEGHRLDRRRGARLRQPRPAARDARRDALVARLDERRRLPVRRGRGRARRLLGGGARRAPRGGARAVPARRGGEPARARGVRHDVRVGAAPPAQRDRARGEGHGRARRLLRQAAARLPARRVPDVLHEQPRREQLERDRVRADGGEPPARVRARGHRRALDAAALHRAGGEPEQAAALLREGHGRLAGAVAGAVLPPAVRPQARAPRARQRGLGGRAADARDERRRSRVRLHAHARHEHRAGGAQLRRRARDGRLRVARVPRPVHRLVRPYPGRHGRRRLARDPRARVPRARAV
ncbi:MAG: GH13 / GH13_36 / GH13_38 / GH13_23 / GH13_ 16 / GH13_20 / GH13_30 / GH13_3 / GH13_17 / GH13 _31 / GH13_1 / GH13_29 / GH13_40 / GH13_2 / GH1 3_4 / GH13_10 / GH13_19 / GH13_37, partial [uncultured Gemmatimonadaceae bacterium]